jgi:hypothetical protein
MALIGRALHQNLRFSSFAFFSGLLVVAAQPQSRLEAGLCGFVLRDSNDEHDEQEVCHNRLARPN